ncbi:ABC transporter ATP-binding protein [Clostridium sp. LIBA-8841]|uniref:ABC transporter ATP-binding protein n=1 Tax=Clostridium sp. LIBA-8841 TaxID=2987530 RepID=UPI002AC654EA|nr:ABC transporter ATP-binding protein [Clostridium sp. LIBA-8841]MDZ5254388.1 ABC transporter ATP-binding protein/permease [Clostridium sp. LIBA-8841]
MKELKELFKKMKWIYLQSKLILPSLILIVIISSTFSLIGVYNALVSKNLIDSAISGNTPDVIKWLTIMASIMLLNILSSPITTLIKTYTSTKMSQTLQKKIYAHITYSNWQESSKHHSMSLLSRLTSDVGTITGTVMQTIPAIISLSVTLLASLTTLIYLAPAVAMVAVFIGPFLLLISRLFARKLKKIYKEIQEEDVKYKTFIQESIKNLIIVKTFCLEKVNLDKLSEIQKKRFHLSMKNTKIGIKSGMTLSICSSIAYFTIFCWGALNLSKGIGTYGTLMAMLQLYNKIQGPFSALAGTFPSLVGSIAATERLMEIESLSLENHKDLEDGLDALCTPKKLKTNRKNFEDSMDINSINSNYSKEYITNDLNINFKDVSFSYDENKPILKDLNLSIEAGEIIGLIGPSGQGKTTLIKILLSLLNINDGNVSLSSSEYADSLIAIDSLKEEDENKSKEFYYRNELAPIHRELISYVPQGDTLFSGTIEENLRHGKPNATLDEIIKATKKACAFDFIEELTEGFNTVIGENGLGISGGQAQRIAIARAFLRDKPILILDEATSALDPETELKVIKEVKNLPHKPLCIIITHRPLALGICNRILELKDGFINEINKENLEKITLIENIN